MILLYSSVDLQSNRLSCTVMKFYIVTAPHKNKGLVYMIIIVHDNMKLYKHNKQSSYHPYRTNHKNLPARNDEYAEWNGAYDVGMFVMSLFHHEQSNIFLEWVAELSSWVDISKTPEEENTQLHRLAKMWITTIQRIVIQGEWNCQQMQHSTLRIQYWHKSQQPNSVSHVEYLSNHVHTSTSATYTITLNGCVFATSNGVRDNNDPNDVNRLKAIFEHIDSKHPTSAALAFACIRFPHSRWSLSL